MALRFPHAQVRGVDLAPNPLDASTFPPNIVFEIDDVNQGLSHLYGQYDLIHARCIMGGIAKGREFIEELQRCLKPGGLVILVDGDVQLLDENFRILKMAKVEGDEDVSGVSEDGSYLGRILWGQ